MVNLVALVLIVLSSAHQAPPVSDPPRTQQVQSAPAPAAPHLTEKQKAWFAHAVDDILDGK